MRSALRRLASEATPSLSIGAGEPSKARGSGAFGVDEWKREFWRGSDIGNAFTRGATRQNGACAKRRRVAR